MQHSTLVQFCTSVSAGREVAHSPLAQMLQGILIVSPPSSLLLGVVPYAVGAAISLVKSGLPHSPLGVPADPQEMREAHLPCLGAGRPACHTHTVQVTKRLSGGLWTPLSRCMV